MPNYQVQTNVASHFVKAGDSILGAYGTSFWRSCERRRTVFDFGRH